MLGFSRRRIPPVGPRLLPAEEVGVRRRLARLLALIASRRRVRPTREGWVFLATALAVALAALNTGNNLLYLVFATMLSLIVLSGILSELSVQRMQVERLIDGRAFAGHPVSGTWRVRNRRRWLPHLAVELDEAEGRDADLAEVTTPVFAVVPAGQLAVREGSWVFTRRGIHRLRFVRVSTTWPFGIFKKWYLLDRPLDVLVYPDPEPGQLPVPLGGPRGQGAQRSSRAGSGDFLGLRDHRDGEDVRLVHWRSSARLGRLVSADREAERGARVLVELAAGAGSEARQRSESFEQGVRRAAGAVIAGRNAGQEIVLDLPDGRRLGPEIGLGVDRLLGELAVVREPESVG